MDLQLLLSLVSVTHDLCELLATKPLTAAEMLKVSAAHETLTKLGKAFAGMKTVQPQPLPEMLNRMNEQLLEANKLLLQIHNEAYAEYRNPVNGGVGVGLYPRFWQSVEAYAKKWMPGWMQESPVFKTIDGGGQ